MDSTQISIEERTAVIACHGMGQQVPFETLNEVADLVRKNDGSYPPPSTRLIAFEDHQVPVATLKKDGCSSVDFFELYWAPVTEGRVSILQTLLFVLKGASQGLGHGSATFTRFVFGAFQVYPCTRNVPWAALGILAVVLVLTFSALNFFGFSVAFLIHGLWFTDLAKACLVGFAPVLIVTALTLLVVLGVPMKHKVRHPGDNTPTALCNPSRSTWIVWTACLAAGLLDAFVVLKVLELPSMEDNLWLNFAIAALWLFGLVGFIFVCNFFVEYFGDVAAYVSSNEVNTFHEIRDQIQARADRIFRAVYGAKQPNNQPTYSRVIVVAHSLGSVIAYDALNALLLKERLNQTDTNAVNQTKLLLTYGSPLDKTAFFFRTQTQNAPIRESLAQDRQPMISADQYRNFPWVNIYSPRDIISGPLDFYDLPGKTNRNAVVNLIDFKSTVPISAHTQYVRAGLLGSLLSAALQSDDYLLATVNQNLEAQQAAAG